MKTLTLRKFIFFALISGFACQAFAKNCGIIGTVYPIAENDLQQVIQQRLSTMQQTGELANRQAKWHQELQDRLDRPQPVAGLQRTTQPSRRIFDPSIRFPVDIHNTDGEIVIAAGTTVNPLDNVALTNTLLFYDADDQDQVQWAKRWDQKLNGQDQLILVNGSVNNQTKLFKKPVFFDQGGRLTTRFGIKRVPAIVSQQGKQLIVQEVTP